MRYEVRFKETGFLKEATDDKTGAMLTAIHMGNWNHPCDVVDVETGEKILEGIAYLAPLSK